MDSESVRLFLVRHGEVDANRSYRYLGRRDDALNDTGRHQAEALAAALVGLDIDAVVSSPLQRAVDTARCVADRSGLSVESDPRLVELDFGVWDGRSRAEVVASSQEDRRLVESWETDPAMPTPGGESLIELQRRVVEVADEFVATRSGSTVVLVSHMGAIKTLLLGALSLPLESANRIFLDPATISVIDWGVAPVVRLVNSHAHLGFGNARWLQR